MKKILAFLLLALLISCTSTDIVDNTPSWIYSPYEGYDTSDYIIAVGSAFSSEKAHYNAVSQIATSFNVNVNSALMIKDDGKNATMNESSLYNSDIHNLKGLDILDSYFDGKTHYVRLGLNKDKVSKLYLSNINEIAKDISLTLAKAKTSDSLIDKLNYIENLNGLVISFNENKQILSILTSYNKSFDAENIKTSILSGITVDVANLKSIIPYLEDKNIEISSSSKNKINMSLEVETTEKDDKYYAIFNLDFIVADGVSELIKTYRDRVVAINELDVKTKVDRKVTSYIDSLVELYL